MYSRQNQGEARLESLLDDLQSTLPRNKNNGIVGNTSSTGYKEVSKSTSRTVGNGRTETDKEYEIQYLNPSNKCTVLNERLPDLQSVDLLRQANAAGGKNAGYETVSSYEYKKSTETKGSMPKHEINGGINLKHNISELDSLLDDLNHSQRTGFSNKGVPRHEISTNESTIEPLMSSTPYKQYSSKHEEHRYGSVNKVPVTNEVISTYESSTSNGQPLGIDITDAPRSYSQLLQNQGPGTYQTSMYAKETTKKVIPGTTTYSTYQPYNPPTIEPAQSKVYNYSEEYRSESQNRSFRDVPRSPGTQRAGSPRSPSPHRSPSPVTFAQPPEPKSYSSVNKYTSKTVSPIPVQKFSPSDPSRTNVDNTINTPPAGQQTVYSYKYSSETRQNTKYGTPNGYTAPVHQEQLPLRQSPFPREEIDSPPEQQKPPRKLDDLMASFGDKSDYYRSEREYQSNQTKSRDNDRGRTTEYTVPINRSEPDAAPKAPELKEVKETEVTSSVAGPAVYYPPGSTTFVKKEEQMQQGQLGRAQMKAKGKGMYKYKSKSKGKEKHSSGATMVPCCLPMCCAMPCVIM
ncbi:serine/arginine repetitive matrix protein 1 isoform X2 [Adelges cooleyi]|uniref:serine/arginine repetitive matrix protein 1 isoform X2 n=1 Tax=Adelges cooleyi TaxID=133065 RepID=UPI002180901D|nr:serine/arginine repetitive matrix protein 1 isoform X2 [Adelges cooleyi]